ncbi:MAG TPA: hypothetical protein VIV12_20220 [Streptosporangiaceae bacterium]
MIVSNIYSSQPISVAGIDREFARADIEFHELDHSGASFEGRVFLNNTSADEKTETSPAHGYAGSFHVFGHGGCFGDEGHCDVAPRRTYDPRPAHPLAPAVKVVIATGALRAALSGSPETITVTVVPVVTSLTGKCGPDDVLSFSTVRIVTYR